MAWFRSCPSTILFRCLDKKRSLVALSLIFRNCLTKFEGKEDDDSDEFRDPEISLLFRAVSSTFSGGDDDPTTDPCWSRLVVCLGLSRLFIESWKSSQHVCKVYRNNELYDIFLLNLKKNFESFIKTTIYAWNKFLEISFTNNKISLHFFYLHYICLIKVKYSLSLFFGYVSAFLGISFNFTKKN